MDSILFPINYFLSVSRDGINAINPLKISRNMALYDHIVHMHIDKTVCEESHGFPITNQGLRYGASEVIEFQWVFP